MKLYKLTNQASTTYNHTMWGAGVTHSKPVISNPELCSSEVLHAYSNKNIAYILNPIHADISNPVLWEAKGEVVVKDFGKVGCFELTTVKQLEPPIWVGSTKENQVRIMFAILCAEAVLHYFEDDYPADTRVRKAIEAAKKYTSGAADAADVARAARAALDSAAYADTDARAALDSGVFADRAVKLIMNLD